MVNLTIVLWCTAICLLFLMGKYVQPLEPEWVRGTGIILMPREPVLIESPDTWLLFNPELLMESISNSLEQPIYICLDPKYLDSLGTEGFNSDWSEFSDEELQCIIDSLTREIDSMLGYPSPIKLNEDKWVD